MCHCLNQKGRSMHLNRTIQPIIIVSSLDQSPTLNVEFFLDPCRAHSPLSIPRHAGTVAAAAGRFLLLHRILNQRRPNEKTLGLSTSTVQRRQRPRIQPIHPSLRLLHQYRRMGQSARRIPLAPTTEKQRLPSPRRHRGPYIRTGQSQQVFREGGVQSVPRLRLPSMQHPVLDGVGPVTRRVVAQVSHDVGAMHGRIGRHLIDGRAAQRHERHLSRLEVDFLGVPFGCYREREGEGGEREGQAEGGAEGASVERDCMPFYGGGGWR
mmetsp:Transcript_15117/g.26997  ORF Transcript_15117/g.26997 Transcript_15117/m.26997 type:complete len:266 (+) Transcript_15117:75-872(+)